MRGGGGTGYRRGGVLMARSFGTDVAGAGRDGAKARATGVSRRRVALARVLTLAALASSHQSGR